MKMKQSLNQGANIESSVTKIRKSGVVYPSTLLSIAKKNWFEKHRNQLSKGYQTNLIQSFTISTSPEFSCTNCTCAM